jgi:PadR family transcriptional regulator PadR
VLASEGRLVNNVVKIMKKKDALGQFEQLVLTAVLLCRDNAYGMAVHAKVEELCERKVKLPAVYVTLDRMLEKGYLKSWMSDPTPERGGRRKRFFKLLAAGDRAMAEAQAISRRILESWGTVTWSKP